MRVISTIYLINSYKQVSKLSNIMIYLMKGQLMAVARTSFIDFYRRNREIRNKW